MTLIIGAALLVVQLAFEIMVSFRLKCLRLLKYNSFMLSTSDGAEELLSWLQL
jgi:hypothetical protein